jgi:hypothetical protein
MAKKKPVARTTSKFRPPRSAGEAMLYEALDGIKPEVAANYVNGIFAPDKKKLTKRQHQQFAQSLFALAALGWSFYCWSKYEEEPMEVIAAINKEREAAKR